MAKIKVLVVGGGGSGGSPYTVASVGGGGGAGGYQYNSSFSVTKQDYSVVIGAGGLGSNNPSAGLPGGLSSFSTITANGGGGGGPQAGGNGGCGGGGSGFRPNISYSGGVGSQGYNGGSGLGIGNDVHFGSVSGGGGGAGSAGQNGFFNTGVSATGGAGGVGVANNISGTNTYYCGGGGGAASDYYGTAYVGAGGNGGGGNGGTTTGTDGTANTGGGGGGASGKGGAGGSGIVIIRYLTADFGTCTGGTKTTDGDYTVHTFLSSGTFVSVPKPEVSTQAISNVKITEVTGNGTIVDAGGTVTERGFCYKSGTTGDPTTADDTVSDTGSFNTGAFSKAITGLSGATSYRVRAYAINSEGINYGTTVSVKTLGVITNPATDVKITEVTGNGNISSNPSSTCSRRGFCYKEGTTGDPTTSDSVVYEDGTFGLGNYQKIITGLSANTNYRVRAYITDSSGTEYGETLQILTKEIPTSSGSFITLLNR